MSAMEINGGSVIAMLGKDCVAIACDLRLGNQALTVACNQEKIFSITPTTYLGLPGLASDTLTVYEKLRHRTNMYAMREDRLITPTTFTHLVSSTLYERRFGPYFIEPIIAGLEADGTPFVATTDLIGCINAAKMRTASEKLYGMSEALWEPGLDAEALFETIGQALLNAVDRDAYSGWGAVVYVIEKDKVTKRTLKARMD